MSKPLSKWPTLSRHLRGYGTQWDKLRVAILVRDNHLCQSCLAKGRVTAANQVDHIVPKAKQGTDDHNNLQSLCKPCHDAKTIIDNGGKPRPTYGADGWPLD